MRTLKLIWDFRGPDATKIAEHHEKHLRDYIVLNSSPVLKTGIENIHELHCIAYLVVEETNMKPIRDALKPHRGQLYQE